MSSETSDEGDQCLKCREEEEETERKRERERERMKQRSLWYIQLLFEEAANCLRF